MRKTSPGQSSKTSDTLALLVFSVGGRRLAARADEVGGIWPWTEAMPVPSGTPYVTSILRRGDEVLPVFDLAQRLQVHVQDSSRLCLIAKRHDGPMAVCIDGDIPTLQAIEPGAIRSSGKDNSDVTGTCRIGEDEMPLYSLARLGMSARPGSSA